MVRKVTSKGDVTMAFETTVKVVGDSVTYRFNPQLKKYALGDTGFVTNNAGAYVMQRS